MFMRNVGYILQKFWADILNIFMLSKTHPCVMCNFGAERDRFSVYLSNMTVRWSLVSECDEDDHHVVSCMMRSRVTVMVVGAED